ncbi:MAG TPA: VWA domain-containing protein [Dehalococcoidia bacterium]
MSFAAPGYLTFLLLVPLAVAAVAAWLIWRGDARRRLGARVLTRNAPVAAATLLIAAIAFAVFAAARPQFGNRETRVEDRGIDLVIVMDVSQSMFATDAQPNRLGRAQTEVSALLDRMTGDRVGLVVFGGTPFVRSPMTSDLPALSRIVAGVREERGLVEPGSDLGAAIGRAQEVVDGGAADTKAILIISDGEDHGGLIATEVANARNKKTRIYTAGVGTAQGSPVIDINPETRAPVERRDASGAPVVTRLDAAALERIAETGGGRYIELSGEERPLTGLASEFDALARTTFESKQVPGRVDRFRIFASIALALAVSSTLLLARPVWRSRRAQALVPLAAGGLLIGAVCGTSVASLNRDGNRQYEEQQYDGALNSYRQAQSLDPAKRELYYNAGNALDRKGDYQGAVDETKRALSSDSGDDLAAKAEYALGNHYAGADQLADAIEAYKRSLLANPGDEDAKHNLEILQARQQASPTPAVPTPPLEIPSPDTGEGESSGGTGSATPPPGGNGQRTPGAGDGQGSPSEGEMTPEELQRSLERALQGIDDDFTVEEAIRVLELLERKNRTELEAPPDGAGAPGGPPDY